jgi:hypothetical protein
LKRTAERCGYADKVYLATHALGWYKDDYKQAELESGETFWSINARPTDPPRKSLKKPDAIITEKDRVKFLIEAKWGTLSGADHDLVLGDEEQGHMSDLLNAPNVYCAVIGPVGLPRTLRKSMPFNIDSKTQFLHVTDISTLKKLAHPKLQYYLDSCNQLGFTVVDFRERIGAIPSFQEVLCLAK